MYISAVKFFIGANIIPLAVRPPESNKMVKRDADFSKVSLLVVRHNHSPYKHMQKTILQKSTILHRQLFHTL